MPHKRKTKETAGSKAKRAKPDTPEESESETESKETPTEKSTAVNKAPTVSKKKSTVNKKSTAVNKKAKPENDSPEYSHWLMKSEPESRLENGIDMKFGIEDLKAMPNQTSCWDGVRNYQARNFMQAMKVGQEAFFYHSNCKEPGIAGLIKIVKESYVDHTQFDKKDSHYDKSSSIEKPRWFMVDVQYTRMLKRFIPLSELKGLHQQHKQTGGPLRNIALFTKARLSVQPLTDEEWDFILALETEKASLKK